MIVMLRPTSRKERVDRAIEFKAPEKPPILYFNTDADQGDIMIYHLGLGRPGEGSPNSWDWSVNEWGYQLVKNGDGTMGHPVDAVYPEFPDRSDFLIPDLREAERMSAVAEFQKNCADRYRLASFDLSGFTIYTFLRGFENSMVDFLAEPDGFAMLMDGIIDFECQIIQMAARHGFHGVHFADDWGTQSGMMISPELWRQLFKPRYKKQFALAKSLGLHTWFHSCGEYLPIMEDFHEIGLDVLNISQPNVNDLPEIGKRLRGKICFMVPISYQTVSITGTPEDIFREAARLFEHLAAANGGFVGYVEDYSIMGMTAENFAACGDAFRALTHRP